MTDRLRTARTLLRRWHDDDLRPFAEMNADPEVMEFFPATLAPVESAAMVERIEQGFETNGFGLWALDVDGRLAGFTGLNRTTFDTPMGPHVEIGWRLARWAWGRALLGRSLPQWSPGSAGAALAEREVGMIAGNLGRGLGGLVTRFPGPHDGAVTVEETRVPGLADHLVLPVGHSGMLVSRAVAAGIARFLRRGRFVPAGEGG